MNDYKVLIADLTGAANRNSNSLNTRDACRKAADAIEQLVRERDAAVKCLPQRCTLCKHYTAEDGACYDERKCADWACHPNWEWRGVQEVTHEET